MLSITSWQDRWVRFQHLNVIPQLCRVTEARVVSGTLLEAGCCTCWSFKAVKSARYLAVLILNWEKVWREVSLKIVLGPAVTLWHLTSHKTWELTWLSFLLNKDDSQSNTWDTCCLEPLSEKQKFSGFNLDCNVVAMQLLAETIHWNN